jgi:hypothetical protein
MENKTFIEDYLWRAVRHDTDRTCVKNISAEDYAYWYDPQTVSTDWSTMMPLKCHIIKAWEIAQFDKPTAFDIWVKMARDFSYAKYWDKWLSAPARWKEFLYKIVFPIWDEPKEIDHIAVAKQVIGAWDPIVEPIEVKEVAKEEVWEDLDSLSYKELQWLYVERTWKKAVWVKKADILTELKAA